jgi:guanylate kinase
MPPMREPLLLMLCSPSGAGKSTLTRHLLAQIPGLSFSVSHTTRAPRKGEEDGVHYHFVDRAGFEREIAAGGFAEWAEVHGNLYGTSLAELDRARREHREVLLFDIDVQGARQVRAALPHAVGVFVLPPSMEELRRRLVERGTDAAEVIERRLAKAADEIAHYGIFQYLIVNDDLVRAQEEIVAIVRAELCRRPRRALRAEGLLRPGKPG